MKVGVPVWSGRVSPVFDVSQRLLVVEIEGAREVARREEPLDDVHPARRVGRLAEMGVEVLICGAVSGELMRLVAARGIRVLPLTCGGVDEVLRAFMDGRLSIPRFRMPGRCGRRRRFRGGREGGWR